MNTQIDFNDIPKNYLYCTHSKCPHHNKCLRYQATLCMPQTLPYYSVVNPSHITGNENNCTFFKPFRTSLFASGMDHLLDNIPHATAVIIRKERYSLMGRSMYYRIRNKERLLHPEEQKQIAAIFIKHGIKYEPTFDIYIEKYDW